MHKPGGEGAAKRAPAEERLASRSDFQESACWERRGVGAFCDRIAGDVCDKLAR